MKLYRRFKFKFEGREFEFKTSREEERDKWCKVLELLITQLTKFVDQDITTKQHRESIASNNTNRSWKPSEANKESLEVN